MVQDSDPVVLLYQIASVSAVVCPVISVHEVVHLMVSAAQKVALVLFVAVQDVKVAFPNDVQGKKTQGSAGLDEVLPLIDVALDAAALWDAGAQFGVMLPHDERWSI
jgi:hypothetical protein